MDRGSEGTFGIPQCSAPDVRRLRINSVNSGMLQKDKSLPDLQPPQNREPSVAPTVDGFHCVPHPSLSLQLDTFVALGDGSNAKTGEPLTSMFFSSQHSRTQGSPCRNCRLRSRAPGCGGAARGRMAAGGQRSRGMLCWSVAVAAVSVGSLTGTDCSGRVFKTSPDAGSGVSKLISHPNSPLGPLPPPSLPLPLQRY